MRVLIFSLLAIAGAAAGQEPLRPGGEVQARAGPAVVVLEPSGDKQEYLRLPKLEFDLSIAPRCAPDFGFRSVLVSIADTRLRLDRRDIEDPTLLQTTLSLPQQQAGQLRIDGFCRQGRDRGATRLEIKDAFTARLSLRCGDDEQESVIYTTVPLNVVLECRDNMAAEESEAPSSQSTLSF